MSDDSQPRIIVGKETGRGFQPVPMPNDPTVADPDAVCALVGVQTYLQRQHVEALANAGFLLKTVGAYNKKRQTVLEEQAEDTTTGTQVVQKRLLRIYELLRAELGNRVSLVEVERKNGDVIRVPHVAFDGKEDFLAAPEEHRALVRACLNFSSGRYSMPTGWFADLRRSKGYNLECLLNGEPIVEVPAGRGDSKPIEVGGERVGLLLTDEGLKVVDP